MLVAWIQVRICEMRAGGGREGPTLLGGGLRVIGDWVAEQDGQHWLWDHAKQVLSMEDAWQVREWEGGGELLFSCSPSLLQPPVCMQENLDLSLPLPTSSRPYTSQNECPERSRPSLAA